MAYPNKTSQSLHTLKINKVPDKETFLKMYDDNLINANELYLVEGDNTATLNVESPITYINNTIGFDGYDVTTTTTTLCNEIVTTSDRYGDGYYSSELTYSIPIDADPIKVTFNNVEYICHRMDSNSGYYFYGAIKPNSVVDFSEYPFSLIYNSDYNENILTTKDASTYTIKIETITDNIAVSSDFAKARGYSIIENPSQILVNESATTTNSGATYSEGTLSYFSESNDIIKVTFNNVEYICPKNKNRYGAQYNSSSDSFDFSTYPFYLEPDSFDGNNLTYIITQTAGTYTVKIETLPKVAMLTDDFKLAVNQSFPGDVMIKGRDYVTAGQKFNSNLGNSATAEGYQTTASSDASHAEGHLTTASGFTSHAEGYYTTASGFHSHAEGYYTTANHKSQHVFGEYNVLDTSTAAAYSRGNYVEIVGKGTNDSFRSNARTLDWNGNEVLAGKLTIGTGPTANMDVATKQYVDNATANIPTKISDLTNDSGFTVDDKTWNGVQLAKQSATNSGDSTYVPLATSTSPVNMSFTPVKKTPTNNAIAKYDSSAYLYSTTPSASDNSTKVATTAFVKTAISGLIGPMMFKGTLGTGGTITTLPTAAEANTGFTYKVITDGTYASIAAKVGDLFISNGSEWIIVPSGDETFVPTLTSTSDGQGHVTLGVTVGPMVNGNTINF